MYVLYHVFPFYDKLKSNDSVTRSQVEPVATPS